MFHLPCTPTDPANVKSACEHCLAFGVECKYTRVLRKRGPTRGLYDAHNLALAYLCVNAPGCTEALTEILEYVAASFSLLIFPPIFPPV
jgi:hypothetical protein